MRKKTILIFGNYGGQNWGDEGILSGLLSALASSRFRIIVISSQPKHTGKHHNISSFPPPPFGIRSFFRFSFLRTIRCISSADIILFGGGGLFQDREKRAIFLWGWYRFIAGMFGKRIIFVGNSVGPLRSFVSRYIAKQSFFSSSFISLRDTHSQELLEKMGIPLENIISSTDALFLLRKLPKKREREGTILAFRRSDKKNIQKIKNIFSILPKPIYVISMDKEDEDFLSKYNVPFLHPKSVLHLRNIFSQSKFVLSSRLHGGIFALQAETPFLLLSAAPKIQHFFSERGFSDILFSEIDEKRMKRKVRDMMKNFSKIQEKLEQVRLQEQKKAKQILPLFLQK
jgi:polysaccharide pyruvyl transferase CsaB